MQTLNLNKTQLATSRYPEFADACVCDKCGTDVTSHLYRGRAHGWRPLGSARYSCRCGEKYVSGLVEWDALSSVEKRVRLSQIVGLLILLWVPLAGFMLLVRTTIQHGGLVLIALSAASVLPTFFVLLWFASFLLEGVDVVAFLWRTRVCERFWRSSKG